MGEHSNSSRVSCLFPSKFHAIAEVKVFGESIPLADTPEEIDRQTWTMDCGAGCLVNVRDDHTEHVNLASDPKYASILSKMQGILKEMNKDRMVVLDFSGWYWCGVLCKFILRQLIDLVVYGNFTWY